MKGIVSRPGLEPGKLEPGEHGCVGPSPSYLGEMSLGFQDARSKRPSTCVLDLVSHLFSSMRPPSSCHTADACRCQPCRYALLAPAHCTPSAWTRGLACRGWAGPQGLASYPSCRTRPCRAAAPHDTWQRVPQAGRRAIRRILGGFSTPIECLLAPSGVKNSTSGSCSLVLLSAIDSTRLVSIGAVVSRYRITSRLAMSTSTEPKDE